jgi:putative membrane protein
MSTADSRGSQGDSNVPAVVIGALAVLVAGAIAVGATNVGPLSAQMAIHIAAMNIVAPLLAASARPTERANAMLRRGLWPATLVQLAVLWAAHSPAVHHAAHASLLSAILLHGILFLSALAFWFSVTGAEAWRWQAMLALIVSGKFACLLGVLLIFAPRVLFEPHAAHVGQAAHSALMADQHLAGLLMIAACPLSYVLTAVILAARAVTRLEKRSALIESSASLAGR